MVREVLEDMEVVLADLEDMEVVLADLEDMEVVLVDLGPLLAATALHQLLLQLMVVPV